MYTHIVHVVLEFQLSLSLNSYEQLCSIRKYYTQTEHRQKQKLKCIHTRTHIHTHSHRKIYTQKDYHSYIQTYILIHYKFYKYRQKTNLKVPSPLHGTSATILSNLNLPFTLLYRSSALEHTINRLGRPHREYL